MRKKSTNAVRVLKTKNYKQGSSIAYQKKKFEKKGRKQKQ